MTVFQILILAVIQGAAELLPVSSSAHVIVAEKLMGLDPTAPQMTLLLVMLHTGTMFAVIVYFWSAWRATYFSSWAGFRTQAVHVIVASAATAVVGVALLTVIKRVVMRGADGFEIEHLFGNARLMAVALAAAGILIIVSGRLRDAGGELSTRAAAWIGAVQGLCLPFRGFSRSGATISTGMVCGVGRRRAEEFSFALAVVITPAVIAKEAHRLWQVHGALGEQFLRAAGPSALGMLFSFAAGLLALRWLSHWLERGRWYVFGGYCLAFALVVLAVG
ncbi:MAG: undecaprenyl-diphosphate phosphatase [Proteobacteria bacterium]|nr:undecaprenyl-diphosphate phosphatase [Pseudomonadota bacterium]